MRSVAAILLAFAITSLLAICGDFVMLRTFPASFDDQGVSHDARILIVMLAYSIVSYVLGGCIAAAVAPHAKRKHAVIFGIVMLTVAAIATSARFDTAPPWFHITNLAAIIPAAALGGRLLAPPLTPRYNSHDEPKRLV